MRSCWNWNSNTWLKRRQGNYRRRIRTLNKTHSEVLEEAFADLSKLLKKLKNMDHNTERFSLVERNLHGALSVYKQIYDEKKTNQANLHGHISEKSDTS